MSIAMDQEHTSENSGVFSSFASPGYAMLFTAGLFSFISVQMQFLLRGVLAWDLTLREGALGLTYLCFGLSMLIATPIGGVATDRLSKRAVLIGSQAVLMVVAILMGIAVLTGIVQFWMLLVAGVAQGVSFGFFGPARVAISSELVGRQHLGNAITLSLLSMNGTRVFAPALAGVLAGIATVGIGGAYLIAGVCSTLSFFFLLRLPRLGPVQAHSPHADPAQLNRRAVNGVAANGVAANGSAVNGVAVNGVAANGVAGNGSAANGVAGNGSAVNGSSANGVAGNNGVAAKAATARSINPIAEIKEGVRYVVARPSLRRLVVSSFFVIMFGFNYVAFYPALVKGVYGLDNTWVGIISSASALGAVVVSFPLAARANSAWAPIAMVISGLCFGLGVMAVGFSRSFWVAFGVICFIGAATTIFQSLSNTLALTMTDDAHQGRVQSLMQLSFAGFGIAALPLGALAEVIGLQPTIVVMGLVAAIAIVVYAVMEGGWIGLRPRLGSGQAPAGSLRDDRPATDSVGGDGNPTRPSPARS